jgi:DNA-binding response OmpR family regulator
MPDTKKKILLAEDDKFISKAYTAGFSDVGFDVTPVTDGDSVVAKVTSEKPDLILLDLIMPGKNGFEVLEELKKNDTLKKIPVIILSNLGQDSDITKGKALGAVDYLIKSNLSMKEVIEKVQFHVEVSL